MKRLHKTGVAAGPGRKRPPAGRKRPAQLTMGSRRPAEKTFATGGITYQFERVNCGKKRCGKCRRGPAHGPYWYAYWWSSRRNRTVSKYVGKTLPRPLVDRDQA